jgi:broad specificity polyphosphatase/5'/3'-nucleotidase SurE
MKAPVGTDVAVLDEGCIAITPLKIDMTDKACMAQLRGSELSAAIRKLNPI